MDLRPFVARIERENLNVYGISVTQHGEHAAAHRFRESAPHLLHSASKTYLSTGIGILMDEGKLRADDRVVDFFPDKLPDTVSDELAAMTVYDLLIMASGHDYRIVMRDLVLDDPDWARFFLQLPMVRMPGRLFAYDSGCTYMLSAILSKITGETALDYLMPRLFIPLGISEKPRWDACPMGVTLGGSGLYLKTEQLPPLGQLYLDGGVYNGQRIVSEAFIADAMRKHIDSAMPDPNQGEDWHSGYGYQLWQCRNGCVRASGAEGQYIIIAKQKDAVIALTSREPRQQAILRAVWEEVYARL
jgi:CubicO group peptidase (beta-lactamase class C family)